jgi:hypothetical protein
MAQFKALAPKVEVNGETVLSILDGMGSFQAIGRRFLDACGIPDPKPGQWFRQQSWLDAFKLIASKVGDSTLFEIGRKIPENAQFPPEVDSIEKALAAIDIAYHMNHRSGEIGHYSFSSTGRREGRMVCDNPYPTEFDRGIIEAMALKFAPYVDVEIEKGRSSRREGGDSDAYRIYW